MDTSNCSLWFYRTDYLIYGIREYDPSDPRTNNGNIVISNNLESIKAMFDMSISRRVEQVKLELHTLETELDYYNEMIGRKTWIV